MWFGGTSQRPRALSSNLMSNCGHSRKGVDSCTVQSVVCRIDIAELLLPLCRYWEILQFFGHRAQGIWVRLGGLIFDIGVVSLRKEWAFLSR